MKMDALHKNLHGNAFCGSAEIAILYVVYYTVTIVIYSGSHTFSVYQRSNNQLSQGRAYTSAVRVSV